MMALFVLGLGAALVFVIVRIGMAAAKEGDGSDE
jgi:hypothetical protein